MRGALSERCAFDLCELGGEEDDLAEWLSAGRFEAVRLLLGGRAEALLLDVLFLLGDVAGREAAFELVDAVGRF